MKKRKIIRIILLTFIGLAVINSLINFDSRMIYSSPGFTTGYILGYVLMIWIIVSATRENNDKEKISDEEKQGKNVYKFGKK